jgi:FtsZ-binding cell division protein ZapB
MNPFQTLLSPLERLITEHGSATIQSKHIALLKEQFSIAEKEIAALKIEVSSLQSENENLKAENQELIQENEKLKNTNSNVNFRMKWGCILFPGDDRLYCPSCFHANGKKIPTSRIDTHNRFCAVCKTKIPSG